MANIRGLFDTSKYEAGIKKLDVRDIIFQLQPEETPFISILSKMSKQKAVDTQFSWFEDDLLGNYTTLTTGVGSTITQLVVADATIFQVGDIIVDSTIASPECMLVKSIDDATHITVQRGFGTTAAQTLSSSDYLYKLGSVMPEGYTTPESLITGKTKVSNYVQIFSKSVMITETSNAVDTLGGNRRNFERQKVAVELKRDLESQFLWGQPYEDTTGSQPRRQTGGIYYFLGSTAPTLDMSSSVLTESAWEYHLKDVFTYSGEDRFAFMGPLPLAEISQFAAAKQRVEPGSTLVYGVRVKKYHSSLGDVNLVLDRHFIGPHAGKILTIEVKQMVYRYLQGKDWSLDLNVQPPNAHYFQDEFNCTIGLEFHLPKLHGIVKNIA